MTEAAGARARDRILIRDLRFRCVVGVDKEERRSTQEVVAQITLHVDLRKAGRTDAITDTVDYRALKKQILQMAHGCRFLLVEALAERIAAGCLAQDRVGAGEGVVENTGARAVAPA